MKWAEATRQSGQTWAANNRIRADKGHIEAGETPERAALRELCEEAGVVAEIRSLAGDLNFMSEGEQVSARYFAMLFVSLCTSPPEREVLWCPFAEARAPLL